MSMFTGPLTRLSAEVDVIDGVLAVNETLRNNIHSPGGPAPVIPEGEPATESNVPDETRLIRRLFPAAPEKLDWQIHDHCAALTRLYAAYERFVNDLISAYVGMLPALYPTYQELPETITTNHRTGIGQILIKIGPRKNYRELDETEVIGALSTNFGSGTQYKLIPQAFLLDPSNYRFEVLMRLFGGVSLENAAASVTTHKELTEFMRSTRGESETVQGELDRFIEYRNEAAHGSAEDLLAPEEIKRIGKFICTLAQALADMVKDEVDRRHLKLGHSTLIGTITAVHYGRLVAVAKMAAGYIKHGDELYLCSPKGQKRVYVLELQLDNTPIPEITTTDGQELGIKISSRAHMGCELRRLTLPQSPPHQQMAFAEILPGESSGNSSIGEIEQDEGSGSTRV